MELGAIAPGPDAPEQPSRGHERRRVALAAGVAVTVALAAVVVLAGRRPQPTAAAAPPVQSAQRFTGANIPAPAGARVSVEVFNATRTRGLGRRAGDVPARPGLRRRRVGDRTGAARHDSGHRSVRPSRIGPGRLHGHWAPRESRPSATRHATWTSACSSARRGARRPSRSTRSWPHAALMSIPRLFRIATSMPARRSERANASVAAAVLGAKPPAPPGCRGMRLTNAPAVARQARELAACAGPSLTPPSSTYSNVTRRVNALAAAITSASGYLVLIGMSSRRRASVGA